jgi:hypothetical protein
MRIILESIPPKEIRYSTCGDWRFEDDGTLVVNVPLFENNDDSAFLVALHELVEAWLCRRDGVTEEEVSAWDKNNPALEEPGDSKNAPYHRQHSYAMLIEKTLCKLMRKNWAQHQRWVEDSANAVDRAHAGVE